MQNAMLDPYLIKKLIFVTSVSIFSAIIGLFNLIFVNECYDKDKRNGVVIQLLTHLNRDEVIINTIELARFKFGIKQRPSRAQQKKAHFDLKNALLYDIDGYRISRLKDRNHFACLFTRRNV